MERNNSEKLDSLISEVVKLSAVMSDISKEVHSVNNRMTGIEAVLNGINGSGGMVKDLANLGEKLSRLGGEHNNLDKQVAKIEISHNDLKEDVRENTDKIKPLFIETNKNSVSSAGINAKMATVMTVISGAMALVTGLAMKYLETK